MKFPRRVGRLDLLDVGPVLPAGCSTLDGLSVSPPDLGAVPRRAPENVPELLAADVERVRQLLDVLDVGAGRAAGQAGPATTAQVRAVGAGIRGAGAAGVGLLGQASRRPASRSRGPGRGSRSQQRGRERSETGPL